MTTKVRAATLAVGTEVTDGQIIDRNSAWISEQLVHAGVEVIEHRAVPDDRALIDRALRDLSLRVDLLFVTGGLGPTSDDFTREVLASTFGLELEYDESSWKQIEEKLGKRGVPVREIQRQQCYYPRSSRVLFNPAGTANAFAFEAFVASEACLGTTQAAQAGAHSIKVIALPGPPPEIAAVWEQNLAQEIEALVPKSERETLHIFRCLGRAESEVAEKTEAAIRGSRLRVGYRAHAPYVEVKLWVRESEREACIPALAAVETALGEWVTNRDQADLASDFLAWVRGQKALVKVIDSATAGAFNDRIYTRLKESKQAEIALPLSIETDLSPTGQALNQTMQTTMGVQIWVRPAPGGSSWLVGVKEPGKAESELEVSPPYNYNLRGERARRYITEKALDLLVNLLLRK